MKVDVVILGAGIVGISAALHLQMRDLEVAVLDRLPPGEGTSFGNAGLIERSSVVPYAFPRSLGLIAKYALNRASAVRYDPSYLPKVAPFLYRYWRNSSPAGLAVATKAMLPLVEASVDEHDPLIEAAQAQDLVRDDGWIGLWKTGEGFGAAVDEARELERYRLSKDVLDAAQLRALEPSLLDGEGSPIGGIHWRDPKTVSDPGALVKRYAALFEKRGGAILTGDAETLRKDAGKWQVAGSAGEVRARQAVIALGPQAGSFVRRFGYRLPFGIKRGYHRHYRLDVASPTHPMVDEEGGYVLAPMARGLRLTTGIEFARPDAPPNLIQMKRAEKFARALLLLGAPIEETPWLGLRPCLPDMRPMIGRAARSEGLWFNFGHAHHGLTLGPACGRLLAEMMTGKTPFVSPAWYSPERFGD